MHMIGLKDDHPISALNISRRAPGVMLALLTCLPIAGTLLVAQVLPRMEQHFADASNVRMQVSLALTVPALVIALASWVGGWLADQVGRRRLLLGALAGYAVMGVIPVLLDGLVPIIATRAVMGLAEALILTCSTALIGDLYPPGRRELFLSLQTSIASAAAVTFAMVGGALGEFGWRTPFLVYAIALPFLAGVVWLVPNEGAPANARPETARVREASQGLAQGPLLLTCLLTMLLSLTFYAAQIQLPFLLTALGASSPATIGLLSAVTNVAVVVGTGCFPFVRRLGLRTAAALCFVVLGAGLVIAGLATATMPLAAGLIVTSFAGGVALPTFLTSAMNLLHDGDRGLGTGLWQSSFWAGQFVSPLVVVALTAATGALGSAVALVGILSLLVALVVPVLLGRGRAPVERHQAA